MTAKRHVIVGAGTAGLNAIRTLRQLGDKNEIVLVSAEEPYSRMVLPYLLERRISEAHAATANPTMLDDWGVVRHFGRRASGLKPKAKQLQLDNGETLSYDNLLIATGSSAARPAFTGAKDPALKTFWTLDDARDVNSTIHPDAQVVVVGAGFITFTILNGLIGRSKNLTLVEAEPRILPRMVDETGAKIVGDWLKSKGVKIRAGARIKRIESKGKKHLLSFAQGPSLSADLVVMATGIRTNLDWLKGSGVKIKDGIVVDGRMQSNIPNVYAAGDIAQGPNLITGANEVHAIEPTAMEHGRVAAANMAGKNVSYPGSLLMNIVSVAGLDVASFGSWEGNGAKAIEGRSADRKAYRKYIFKGDRMIGAIMVGPQRETWSENDLGMIKGLIQSGVNLGQWKGFLAGQPFSIKKPYLATQAVASLLPKTVLGGPSASPRG